MIFNSLTVGQQGFKWCARRLLVDEDGDVADEFFDEASPDSSRSRPIFCVKHSTRPAVVRRQTLAADGSVCHWLSLEEEYSGFEKRERERDL